MAESHMALVTLARRALESQSISTIWQLSDDATPKQALARGVAIGVLGVAACFFGLVFGLFLLPLELLGLQLSLLLRQLPEGCRLHVGLHELKLHFLLELLLLALLEELHVLLFAINHLLLFPSGFSLEAGGKGKVGDMAGSVV